MSAVTIRPERGSDHSEIHALTEAAFRDMEHSDGSEPRIVDNLRADGDLTLSLVAEDGERIVGHLALSPVTISDGSRGWYGLGPVSVLPECQRQGIGGKLITRAIADLRLREAGGIVLLGAPAYYARFGFEHDPALTHPGPPPEYFQRLVLDGSAPSGVVRYAKAFG
ncbi:GNAT family N-acetyltransferase [Pseudoblastomonas halimionae]|uniref:GNAT family N-acetyltransferase n=1 Tax=Alteriqipengyuania halimionae TaxID=1926630 RepID=A0A6I4U4Q8_9SPHN|nr:N-acetyltransferase [Alteriqipengyuania halimionae]MXP10716.1 GNAT family N-acetyltransferase [Alteriqipengyuania halimionae]